MAAQEQHSAPEPDPEPHEDLPVLRRSYTLHLADGSSASFPSLDDYVDQLVTEGTVRDRDDLVRNYDHLVAEIFLNWVSAGQTGCLFAARLARRPRQARWLPIVQLDALRTPELPQFLNVQLDAAARSHEAVALVFPDITTAAEIVVLCNRLCEDRSGRWYRVESGSADGLALIGLRWVLSSGTSVNHVLGFAPLPTAPATRRAPFTALVLRVVDDKRTPSKQEDGRVQVHLADLDSGLRPQELHDRVWRATETKKALYVEPTLAAGARARVTFSIPADVGEQLCAAREVTVVDQPPDRT